MTAMTLVAACQNVPVARQLASESGGILLVDGRADGGEAIRGLPFVALACVTTDNLTRVGKLADVGLYLVCRRVIKTRPAPAVGRQTGVVGVFTMIANPSLGHEAADAYWRDQHAPLALSIHKAMDSYVQLSVVHRFHGPAWDGFALCGFPSLTDLKEHFYDTEEGRRAIAVDTRVFADVDRSPRRVIMNEYCQAAS